MLPKVKIKQHTHTQKYIILDWEYKISIGQIFASRQKFAQTNTKNNDLKMQGGLFSDSSVRFLLLKVS